ncbi:MAG: hypothetical protein Q8787_02715, partial [Sweet potato little leaf phytoplasma]|nr:hypothetical protein [Sweet potato little leaf phytoplasma]
MNLLTAYPEYAKRNAVEYLNCFEPAFLKDGLADSAKHAAIRAAYECLVVCNAPAAVKALDMAHNHHRVLSIDKITVALFTSYDGTDYGDHGVMWWEDFLGSTEGGEGFLTEA